MRVIAQGPPEARRELPVAVFNVWGAVALALLLVTIFWNRRPIFWDEVAHLTQARALATEPGIVAWLRNNATSACGPLHPWMHYALSGGGVLPPPWVRLPNVALLALTLWLMARLLPRVGGSANAAWAFLAVPTTWVVSGLALTEPPAIAGAAIATFAAVQLGTNQHSGRIRWLTTLAIGYAAATLGRQPYVAIGPALVILACRRREDLRLVLIAAGLGIVPLALVAAVWGGLLPPKLAFAGGGIRVVHGVLALCVTGMVALLLAPRFFVQHWRWGLPAGLVAGVTNLVIGFAPITALSSVQRMLGNPAWAHLAEQALGGVAVAAGAGFAVCTLEAAWRTRDRIIVGAATGVLALSAACVANVYQFSSRYAIMGLPLLLILLARWMDLGIWAVARWTIGAAAGCAALRSYFLYAP